ncbi:nitroreductase family protein [Fibrobacter sp. UWB5]|uniref:nitroreductase family protein n=1 Tax=Fibrobacter sp. UWB5 TaxID=1964360 RepID=UPI000B525132|nr:nitroreductase family protein [Fibrobacter sp. UWB5]OWV14375.1 hypothetical protein B7989_02660 [Fibrobacter sp. UWB5]
MKKNIMSVVRKIMYHAVHPLAALQKIRYLGKNHLEVTAIKTMKYDLARYVKYAGVFHPDTKENLEARIIHTYHGLEKGLTMPNRKFNFGHDAVSSLVELIKLYTTKFGKLEGQVEHAVGILKAYLDMHKEYDGKDSTGFWSAIHKVTDDYPLIQPAIQPHVSSADFYKYVTSDFAKFAKSRHTLRHYTGHVSEEEIQKAVELAMTAPSACNRQPVRVHCVCEKEMVDEVLMLQSGNRGFGKDADKVLIISGDLADVCWVDERYDTYTNCGIFIMNLCYSLFYYKIAHCVLNWSICVDPIKDRRLHELAGIPDSEVVAAMITCGKTPDVVDVAESPRKDVSEILRFH